LYQELLNWSDNEEVRREVDRKLLQHAYDKLLVLPKEQKDGQREKVWKWAEGLVILKHPFELAWNIIIEWKDCESIGATLWTEYRLLYQYPGLILTRRA
jgi:superkiller protein 3